ncbi:hypothetical protein ACFU99_05315 [Streptomyces sp. NPDC057654]|uniref:hypothetical protein n=1 Tax=Streptomyces sp. NPDC057654 TaxID=3346196 RepID=UPI0036A8BCB8
MIHGTPPGRIPTPGGSPGTRPKPSSRMKLWGIAAGVVALITAAGVVVSVTTGSSPAPVPSSGPAATRGPAEGGARARVVDGVPLGYPRTADGAKAAAANFATVRGSAAYLTDEHARHRAATTMSSNAVRQSAASEADRTAAQAAKQLQGDARKINAQQSIARTGVLSAHALAVDTHKATIRLWITSVRGNSAGHAPPQASFQSVTVSLLWEQGSWKASGFSTAPGMVAPLSTRQATNTAADFVQYVPEEAADPVLSGIAAKGGLPGQYPRDEQGVRAAATSAVMLYGDPRFFIDADWRHRMLRATAAPSTLSSVTRDADSTARLVAENRQLGDDGKTADEGRLVTRTAVLATRTLTRSDQAASVELWTASLGGVAGGADESQRPQVGYLRMTVDLVWADGTWKTTAVTPSEPLVPTPPAAEQASPASGFAEVGGTDDAPALA